MDVLFRGATVVDGSGAAGVRALRKDEHGVSAAGETCQPPQARLALTEPIERV